MSSRARISITSGLIAASAFIAPPLALFSGLAIAPLLGLIMVVALLEGSRHRMLQFPSHPIIFFIILFSAWAFAACFWSIKPDDALESWSTTFSLLLLAVMAWPVFSHLSAKEVQRIGILLGVGIVIALSLVLVELANAGLIFIYFKEKFFGGEGLLYNADTYNRGACFLAVIFWPFAFYMLRGGGRLLWPLMVLWLGVVLALVSLESLSARLAVLAASAVFAVVMVMPVWGGRLLLLTVLASFVAVPFMAGEIRPREYTFGGMQPSSMHRLFIWDFVEEKAQEKPWKGWGFASSREIPGGQAHITLENQSTPEDWTFLPRHPHNAILQLWLELGFVGMLLAALLVVMAYFWLEKTVHSRVGKASYLSFFAAHFVVSMSAFSVWQEWWVATWLLGLLLLEIFKAGLHDGAGHRLVYKSRL